MSVEARIKQNSIFRKKLNLGDIIKLTDLSYGTFDGNYILIPNETSNHTLIYDEKRLARGIDVSFDGSDIVLFLSLPTSSFEIKSFYEIIEKICAELKTTSYYREGVKVNLNDNDRFISADEEGSICGLKSIQENIEENKYKLFDIFCVYNPISIGYKELKQINNSLENFENYLHDIQSLDVYYAAPRIFKVEDKLIGIYAISPNIPSVVPTEPYIVLNQIQGIEDWYVIFDKGKTIKYDDFINNINSKEYYDARHIIALLNDNDINDLVNKYCIEI
ncbi:MAG: DUF4299 family protein [Acutalibacteraceae bacterium]